MNNINPIYYLQEGIIGSANRLMANNKILTRVGVGLAHWGNNKLIVKKVLDAFPTPDSLKNYLMRLPTPAAQRLGDLMDPNMPFDEYIRFVQRNFTNKFNWAHLISGRVGMGIQAFRAAKNGLGNGADIVGKTAAERGFDNF